MSEYKVQRAFFRPVLACKDVSMTKQEFKQDCDVVSILKRFEATGVLPQPNANRSQIGEAFESDFQELANNSTLEREFPVEQEKQEEKQEEKMEEKQEEVKEGEDKFTAAHS